MCRNITELRGLQPAATPEEIAAAARQYVRKVSGITHPSSANAEAFEAGSEPEGAVVAETFGGTDERQLVGRCGAEARPDADHLRI